MSKVAFLFFVSVLLLNQSLIAQPTNPPTSFSTTINSNVHGDVDIVLYKYSMRDPNFQVFTWDGIDTITPYPLPDIRTYRGYIANGKLKGLPLIGCWYQDDKLFIKTQSGKGSDFDIEFNDIDTNNLSITTLNLPLVTAGKAKYHMDAGITTTWRQIRDRTGGDLDMAITLFEYGINQFDAAMARDVGLSAALNLVILPGNQEIGETLDYWRGTHRPNATNEPINSTPNMFWGIWGSGGGAGGKNYCTNWRGGIASMYKDASGALTHEFGHTMGLSHYNNQVDYMDSNHFFTGRESSMRIHSQIERTSINCISGHTPTYTEPLRPYTPEDYAVTEFNTPLIIDVLANDIDYNGDVITIKDVDPVSQQGGLLKQVGQKIEYTPPVDFKGRDVFYYRAQSGDKNSIYNSYLTNYAKVIVDTRKEELAVHYSFEEEIGYQIFNHANPSSIQTRAEIENGIMENFSTSGIVGNSVHFKTSTDIVKMSDALDPLNKSWSISMWFNMDEIPSGDITKSYTGALLYDSGSSNRGSHSGVAIDIKPNGIQLNAQDERRNQPKVIQDVTWQTNKWYHVVMVIDRDTNKIKGYLDGVPFSSDLSGENIDPNAFFKGYPSGRGLYKAQTVFGGTTATEAGGTKKYFLGKIDEVKIFTKKISESEVLAEYNNPGASGVVNNCSEGLFELEPIRNISFEKDIIAPSDDRATINHDWYYAFTFYRSRVWTNHLFGSDVPQAPDGKNWLYLDSENGAIYQQIGTWKENLAVDIDFVYSKFLGDNSNAGLEVSIWAGGGPGKIKNHLSNLGATKLDSVIILGSELDTVTMIDKLITLNTGKGNFMCGEPLWLMFSTHEGGRSRRCLVDKINIKEKEITVNINDAKKETPRFNIIPNPTTDLITIQSEIPTGNLIISNTIGQVIYSQILTNGKATINVSNLPNGVYNTTIWSDNLVITKRFIKI
ncbi:LamG-like jellyroll fold domain-containing protein [Bacteroidota bacterium]